MGCRWGGPRARRTWPGVLAPSQCHCPPGALRSRAAGARAGQGRPREVRAVSWLPHQHRCGSTAPRVSGFKKKFLGPTWWVRRPTLHLASSSLRPGDGTAGRPPRPQWRRAGALTGGLGSDIGTQDTYGSGDTAVPFPTTTSLTPQLQGWRGGEEGAMSHAWAEPSAPTQSRGSDRAGPLAWSGQTVVGLGRSQAARQASPYLLPPAPEPARGRRPRRPPRSWPSSGGR